MILGIGIGWLAEEFAAIGVPFAERAARTDDHVAALRALWSDEPTHHSEFTEFTNCIVRPRPSRRDRSRSTSAVTARRRRAAPDVSATGTTPCRVARPPSSPSCSPWPGRPPPTAGRDPTAIEMTTGGAAATGRIGPDEIRALADIGSRPHPRPVVHVLARPSRLLGPLRRRGHRQGVTPLAGRNSRRKGHESALWVGTSSPV